MSVNKTFHKNFSRCRSWVLFVMLLSCFTHRCYGQITLGGDTLRGNVKKVTSTIYLPDYIVKTVLTRDTAKGLVVNSLYDEKNMPMGQERENYDAYGRIVETGFYTNNNEACYNISNKYDARGRKTEEQTVSASCSEVCNNLTDWFRGTLSNWFTGPPSSNIYLCEYSYDNSGRVSEMQSKSFKVYLKPGDPETIKMIEYYRSVGMDDRDTTISIVNYKYDPHGKVSETAIKKFIIYSEPEKLDTIEINEFERSITGNKHQDTMLEITSYRYDTKGNTTQEMKQEIRLSPDYPDTAVKITDYKYDSRNNKIEEAIFEGIAYEIKKWYGDKQFTSKTVYRYDTHNNLIEEKEYSEGHERSPKHSGVYIGRSTEYNYDSVNNAVSYISYNLYREDDGSETKEVSQSRQLNDEIERAEYDDHGNAVKKTRGGKVILTREIEYY